MMKNKFKSLFIVFAACFVMYGCGTKKSNSKLNFKIPSCMYYEEKIYWEVAKVEDINDAEYLNKVKQSESDNVLPSKNFYVSSAGKSFINKKTFKKDNFLYIESEDGYHQFAYYEQMEIEKEDVVIDKENRSEEPHAPDAMRPHFVYKGMRYFITENKPNEDDLSSFKNVGKIKSVVHYASKDFSGNINVGDSLYANDNQNRFMIVKYTSDGTYDYYENQAYLKNEY